MKKSFIILWLLSCTIYLFGQDVSESLAVKMANDYYQRVKVGKTDTSSIPVITDKNRVPERISPLGKANMWLVPVEDGWMILSGNKKATPILAHIQSPEKPIYDSLPPAAQWLLNSYEDYIAYINEHDGDYVIDERWQEVEAKDEANSIRGVRAPITEVRLPMYVYWGQTGGGGCDKCFNKFCPYVNEPDQCYKAAAGCVAIAIAQIMWYWKWPYAAYVPTTPGGSTTDLKFYDWSKMPSYFDNSTAMEKVDMTAGFIRDCGYAVDMDYGISSYADDEDALSALVSFGYNENTMELKHKWNTSGWTDLMRSNIDNGQPIYYGGYGTTLWQDGHAFVVDGYRTGGPMYHINWGWQGQSNNWYNIDDAFINDTVHYEYWQSAIFGIKPAPVCTDLTINSSLPSLPSKFCVAVGGVLTVSNRTLQNIVQGELYSSSQVRLTTGTTIKQGSNVHIAIKDIPCSAATSKVQTPQSTPTRDNSPIVDSEWGTNNVFSISPNPVNDILNVTTNEELAQISIYILHGQCVLQTRELNINVAHLPAGVYMLQAVTIKGQSLQSKFIKR